MITSSDYKVVAEKILLPILAFSAGTAFFYFAGPILVPIVAAFALSYLLLPLVNSLEKIKIPHSMSVIIVMAIVLVISAIIIFLFVNEIADFAISFPMYKEKALVIIENLKKTISDYLGIATVNWDIPKQIPVNSDNLQSIGKYFFKGLSSVTSFLFGAFLMYFLTLFMLLDSRMFQNKLRLIFGTAHAETTENIFNEINRQLKGFLQVKFSIVIALSIIITIGLLIFDVKYAYIWGPLAGIMNLIPYVGSIVSSIPPIIVAGIQFNSIMSMVYVAIFFVVVQFIEGNVITPKLTSGMVDLNTLAVLIATMYWGWLWGGVGIILAVPITAAMKVICDHVEPLKPIGVMLGSSRSD